MADILIVDDNEFMRQVLTDFICKSIEDVEVIDASDGEQALNMIADERPRIVFMDIELPGENGISLTKKIVDTYPGTFVFVLTNHDYPEYRKAAMQSGAKEFLSKINFESNFILELIHRYLESNGA